jgi:hypothetical protein
LHCTSIKDLIHSYNHEQLVMYPGPVFPRNKLCAFAIQLGIGILTREYMQGLINCSPGSHCMVTNLTMCDPIRSPNPCTSHPLWQSWQLLTIVMSPKCR